MDDVTRRHAIKLAAIAGAITTGTVALGAVEARADEDKPHDVGVRVELDDDETKMVEEAERSFSYTKGREQQLPYGWTVPGIFDLNGIVHFPPGAEPYSDGTVTGLIYGTYKLTKAHPRARLYDDRVRSGIVWRS